MLWAEVTGGSYQAQVPAVARAVRVLEHLTAAQQPMGLSALSRALQVSPSSLLAILNTLRSFGLVSRSPRDGRFAPGPGLAELGGAAAQRLEPQHTFDALATELVDELGETVLLWAHQGDGLVVAASREGTHPLRFVPPLGLRLAASGWSSASTQAQVAEGELEPGVWMLAVSLDEGNLLAIVGPITRLAGPGGQRARQLLVQLAGGEQAWAAAGPIGAAELDSFLRQPLVASLGYLSNDGYPATVPLWYDWDGHAFWLIPSPAAEWAAHVQRNPRVSLAISESNPPLRRVLARGPIASVPDPEGTLWRSVEARLATRYARLDAARHLASRWQQPRVLRLQPERLIAWRGLLRPVSTAEAVERRRAL